MQQVVQYSDILKAGTDKINANFTELYVLPIAAYGTVLTFDVDKDIYKDATGLSITFTLGSGNNNGVGIIMRLNKPTAVSLPGSFEATSSSVAVDATKLNVFTFVYFSNWNGTGTPHVIYSNTLFASL